MSYHLNTSEKVWTPSEPELELQAVTPSPAEFYQLAALWHMRECILNMPADAVLFQPRMTISNIRRIEISEDEYIDPVQ